MVGRQLGFSDLSDDNLVEGRFNLIDTGHVERDYMNAQLCRDLGHAVAVRWSHPPPHISLNSFAVKLHCSAPSSSLVEECSRQRGVNFPGRGVDRLEIVSDYI